MSAPGGRRGGRRGGHQEEHENHERWLVSYADMMTLLMVLFVVLFAIGQVDQRKFAMLKEGLAQGFGATASVPISGGNGIAEMDGAAPSPVDLQLGMGIRSNENQGQQASGQRDSSSGGTNAQQGGVSTMKDDAARAAALQEIQRLGDIERRIRLALKRHGLQDDVRFKVTERGLVVALVSDDVFFESASANLRPRGVLVLKAVDPTIRGLPNPIAVEGHANHLTITSSVYPTNWELSGARAAGVVRWLASPGGISVTRLSATGYGSSRPLYPASDPRSIRFNRRVDLVLVSNQPPEVRALLPRLAHGLSDL
jgi:chemotaxis protein MotB